MPPSRSCLCHLKTPPPRPHFCTGYFAHRVHAQRSGAEPYPRLFTGTLLRTRICTWHPGEQAPKHESPGPREVLLLAERELRKAQSNSPRQRHHQRAHPSSTGTCKSVSVSFKWQPALSSPGAGGHRAVSCACDTHTNVAPTQVEQRLSPNQVSINPIVASNKTVAVIF